MRGGEWKWETRCQLWRETSETNGNRWTNEKLIRIEIYRRDEKDLPCIVLGL